MTPKGRLFGITSLITGAGRGIGLATAVRFAGEGANLILIARSEDQLAETAAICDRQNVKVFVQPVDISNFSRVDQFFDSIPSDFRPINILINNAAHFDSGAMADYDTGSFEFMLKVNLTAPLYLSQKVILMMKAGGGGTIVNISSLSGCFGAEKFPGFGAYNISKYGLWGLTEMLALEHKQDKIRVNQLSLSGVDTEMFRRAVPPGVKANLTPEEVAGQILYLASDESYPLTGENIILTGMPK